MNLLWWIIAKKKLCTRYNILMRSHSLTIYWTPLLLALMFSSFLSSPVFAQSTTGLPTGCHLATEADKAAGGASVVVGVTNICPTDVKAGINADVGAAKDYLNTLPKRPLSQCAPPTQQNIQRLNNGFAVCAAAFFKAYTAKYGNVYITSAFRDNTPGSAPNGKQSANQCAGGAPMSRHAMGLAIDVNPASESLYPTMWKFAEANPQFGVCFPYQDGKRSGYFDRPHMTLAGGSGREASLCAAQGVTKPCVAGASFVPTTPSTGGKTSSPGGTTSAPSPQIPLPPTRDVNGTPQCQYGYILFEGQCFPAPEEAIPALPGGQACTLDAQMCPDGSYVGRTGPNCSFAACPINAGQSYCQIGYVFANGQCLPTQCNGSSAYAVYNGQVISCNQQQNNRCPQGSLMIYNICIPFSQNQGTMMPAQGGLSQTSGLPTGSQSPTGTVPAGSTQTGGTGTSGQGSTVIDNSQCTPRIACQSGIVYQQTNLCAIQILQTCQYGCATDGINCATAASTSPTGTTTGTANTPLSTVPSRILEQIERLTGAGTVAPTPIINSTVLTEADISAIRLQGLGNGTPLSDMLPSTFNGSRLIYPNGIPDIFIPINTFEQTSPSGLNGVASESYSSSQLTLLQSAFRNIRWTIEGILTYLRIIQQPASTSL
jgi:hypothetical protein